MPIVVDGHRYPQWEASGGPSRMMKLEGADQSEPARFAGRTGADRMQARQTACATRINPPMTTALPPSLQREQVAAQCSHK